jgi:hypothetical protein
MHLSSPPYVPHVLSISVFFTWSPEWYLVRSTQHKASCYVVFSTPLLPHPSWVKISSSASRLPWLFLEGKRKSNTPFLLRKNTSVLTSTELITVAYVFETDLIWRIWHSLSWPTQFFVLTKSEILLLRNCYECTTECITTLITVNQDLSYTLWIQFTRKPFL